jgi:hypothetical protein
MSHAGLRIPRQIDSRRLVLDLSLRAGIRTIEHNGGLDSYLLAMADHRLPVEGRRLKRRITKALAARPAA